MRIAVGSTNPVKLGEAMDALSGRHDTRLHEGAVGVLTAGLCERREAYAHLIKMALARFLTPQYYE